MKQVGETGEIMAGETDFFWLEAFPRSKPLHFRTSGKLIRLKIDSTEDRKWIGI
jgi:hypothetical protein